MVDDVISVENQLQVSHPALVPDKELASSVETVLIWSPEVDSTNIISSAKCGWITLTGTVKSCKQKHLATELIESVPGVIGITNELTVIPTERPADQNIATEIIRCIEHHRDLDANQIDVVVNQGKVTLEGTVSNWLAYRTVEEIALVTEGVIAVKNYLTFK
ncbi:MAG: BON domain-containing protein, partial [Planctomycetaceae bacterium]|nr:BON domain-containing protein [Planctomycetaceae bacterium]